MHTTQTVSGTVLSAAPGREPGRHHRQLCGLLSAATACTGALRWPRALGPTTPPGSMPSSSPRSARVCQAHSADRGRQPGAMDVRRRNRHQRRGTGRSRGRQLGQRRSASRIVPVSAVMLPNDKLLTFSAYRQHGLQHDRPTPSPRSRSLTLRPARLPSRRTLIRIIRCSATGPCAAPGWAAAHQWRQQRQRHHDLQPVHE